MLDKEIDLLADLGEAVIDITLDEGVLKEIPFLKTLYTVITSARSLPERIFAAKVRRFLKCTSTLAERHRAALEQQLKQGQKKKAQMAEVVVLALDRLDRLDKADLLATIFIALLRQRIGDEEFRQLTSAILQCDLDVFQRFIDALDADSDHNPKTLKFGFESLIGAGLTRGSGTMSVNSSGTFTKATKLGLTLYKILREAT